mmetsp:Transcript_71407/g.187203  ORF Transcript_71407/g.187203 Transcript_71407/m.187203 type:complete len:323 (+) Transcript_71407:153-1121(+)
MGQPFSIRRSWPSSEYSSGAGSGWGRTLTFHAGPDAPGPPGRMRWGPTGAALRFLGSSSRTPRGSSGRFIGTTRALAKTVMSGRRPWNISSAASRGASSCPWSPPIHRPSTQQAVTCTSSGLSSPWQRRWSRLRTPSWVQFVQLGVVSSSVFGGHSSASTGTRARHGSELFSSSGPSSLRKWIRSRMTGARAECSVLSGSSALSSVSASPRRTSAPACSCSSSLRSALSARCASLNFCSCSACSRLTASPWLDLIMSVWRPTSARSRSSISTSASATVRMTERNSNAWRCCCSVEYVRRDCRECSCASRWVRAWRSACRAWS